MRTRGKSGRRTRSRRTRSMRGGGDIGCTKGAPQFGTVQLDVDNCGDVVGDDGKFIDADGDEATCVVTK